MGILEAKMESSLHHLESDLAAKAQAEVYYFTIVVIAIICIARMLWNVHCGGVHFVM